MVFVSQNQSVEQRKYRNRLKSGYTRQTAIGSVLLLVSLVLIPSLGGFSELHQLYQRLSYTESAHANLKTQQANFYSQTGTAVAFGLWDISYEFNLDGQRYHGEGQIENNPQFVDIVTVYYQPQNPALNSVKSPSWRRFFLVLILLLAPLTVSVLLLAWAVRSYCLYKNSVE